VTGQTNQLPAGSRKPAMSADGRIIAYESQPVGSKSDVYIYDQLSGQNVLVSRAFGKTTGGNDNSSGPVVSADGRFIAFESWASDLVATDANGLKDVFVYDRYTDQ
jgi:Tol biopolymer transport system component